MGNCFGVPVNSHSSSTSTGASTPASLSRKTSGNGHSPSSNVSSAGGAGEVFPAEEEEGRILESPNLRIFTFSELRSATRNFRSEFILGEGGFGRVYKGWLEEKNLDNPNSSYKASAGMAVAVKKLNPESLQGVEEWQSEVNFLGRLSHPNLVKLLGYCWEGSELLLVYEFMIKGSLENHLFRRAASNEPLPWDLRVKIALGAAHGLAFLHASEKQVIYRDLKASNILLDSNFNPKLSDFGLAKNGPTGGESHVTTRVMGTYGYAAPEYVATGHLYVKSDVYGFGVVLLEMLSGQRALDNNRPSGQYNLVDWGRPLLERRKLTRVFDPRLEGQYTPQAAHLAAQLTLKCLSVEPKSRPSMKEVVQALREIDALKCSSPASSRHSPAGLQLRRRESPIRTSSARSLHGDRVAGERAEAECMGSKASMVRRMS